METKEVIFPTLNKLISLLDKEDNLLQRVSFDFCSKVPLLFMSKAPQKDHCNFKSSLVKLCQLGS